MKGVKGVKGIGVIAIGVMAVLVVSGTVLVWAGEQAKPAQKSAVVKGDPINGKDIFAAQRCALCHTINGSGGVLGPDLTAGQVPQLVVPAGVWQGTKLIGNSGFALLGATMAPGFDYADYRGGKRNELAAGWSKFEVRIAELTPRG